MVGKERLVVEVGAEVTMIKVLREAGGGPELWKLHWGELCSDVPEDWKATRKV